jgi:hypothetical protein
MGEQRVLTKRACRPARRGHRRLRARTARSFPPGGRATPVSADTRRSSSCWESRSSARSRSDTADASSHCFFIGRQHSTKTRAVSPCSPVTSLATCAAASAVARLPVYAETGDRPPSPSPTTITPVRTRISRARSRLQRCSPDHPVPAELPRTTQTRHFSATAGMLRLLRKVRNTAHGRLPRARIAPLFGVWCEAGAMYRLRVPAFAGQRNPPAPGSPLGRRAGLCESM